MKMSKEKSKKNYELNENRSKTQKSVECNESNAWGKSYSIQYQPQKRKYVSHQASHRKRSKVVNRSTLSRRKESMKVRKNKTERKKRIENQ